MFNHTSLALKLHVQNANGSTIDVLATSSYVKKGKQARIQEKQTINVTSASCFFLFVCLFVCFDFEMAIAITLHSELRLLSLQRDVRSDGQTVITRLVKLRKWKRRISHVPNVTLTLVD